MAITYNCDHCDKQITYASLYKFSGVIPRHAAATNWGFDLCDNCYECVVNFIIPGANDSDREGRHA